MPTCCGVMRGMMGDGDKIPSGPPRGNGASLHTLQAELSIVICPGADVPDYARRGGPGRPPDDMYIIRRRGREALAHKMRPLLRERAVRTKDLRRAGAFIRGRSVRSIIMLKRLEDNNHVRHFGAKKVSPFHHNAQAAASRTPPTGASVLRCGASGRQSSLTRGTPRRATADYPGPTWGRRPQPV